MQGYARVEKATVAELVAIPRPENIPAGSSWPPETPHYAPGNFARRDKESPVAFNREAAIASFGEEKVDAIRSEFTGDLWLLLLLRSCEEHVRNGGALEYWNSRVAEIRNLGVEIHLEGADLAGMRLEGADLCKAHLNKARLDRTKLKAALLRGAILRDGKMHETDLTEADLTNADLSRAVLNKVVLKGANLRRVKLELANIAGCELSGARLVQTRGLFGRNRATESGQAIAEYHAQNAVYKGALDIVSWEHMSFITRLRLFGVSYLTIAAITMYVAVAQRYNMTAKHARDVAAEMVEPQSTIAGLWARVLSGLSDLPTPEHLGRQLILSLCVAVATSVYVIWCPPEVKEANEVRWTRAMQQPLWEYRAAAWSRFVARYVCLVFLCLGGGHSLYYLFAHAVEAIRFLLKW